MDLSAFFQMSFLCASLMAALFVNMGVAIVLFVFLLAASLVSMRKKKV